MGWLRSQRGHIMADKQPPQQLGGTAIKPVGWDRKGWEAFSYMIYNPETGEVLTRTPLSWLLIFVFYVIYYSCLAGFWIGCLHIFFATLPANKDGPRWTQNDSIIGDKPGVGLRPHNTDERIDSQMFVLIDGASSPVPNKMKGEGDSNADYANRTYEFFKVYNKAATAPYNTFKLTDEKEGTEDKEGLGECGKHPYGFLQVNEKDEEGNEIVDENGNVNVLSTVQPCIFLKLNTIWGWTPEAIDNSSYTNPQMDDEPLPDSLIKIINKRTEEGKSLEMVWVDCEGRYPADKEAFEFDYFPKYQGFPTKYFPYKGKSEEKDNEKIYHSPLVAFKVKPKESAYGQLIHIQCKAYYKNVIHSSKEKQGMVQFEVQVKKY